MAAFLCQRLSLTSFTNSNWVHPHSSSSFKWSIFRIPSVKYACKDHSFYQLFRSHSLESQPWSEIFVLEIHWSLYSQERPVSKWGIQDKVGDTDRNVVLGGFVWASPQKELWRVNCTSEVILSWDKEIGLFYPPISFPNGYELHPEEGKGKVEHRNLCTRWFFPAMVNSQERCR